MASQLRVCGEDVATWLSTVNAQRGKPLVIQADNGPEFVSLAMDHWAYCNQVQLDFSRSGKPIDNAVIGIFHSTLRWAGVTQHYCIDLTETRRALDTY